MECFDKVNHMSQSSLLIPRKPLIISNLRIHNPAILSIFNISVPNYTEPFSNRMFIIIPFYKNILGMGKIIKSFFMEHCNTQVFRKYIEDVHVSIAYKQPNRLQQFIRNEK